MMLAIGVVGGLYFYLEDPANLFQHTNETPSLDPDKLELLLEELQAIKDSLAKTNMLRMHLDELFTKIFLQQESMIEEVVAKAIDNYDADKIGLYGKLNR
ncbi:unnamed protein product [Acanthoscelides obtectus]|nr:unnamed protein product [Acanthoscelides obtectus]CAK1668791.1 hypothetical protein AOBTE_LOCUS26609 [Acanthoscelides obtectus]